MGCTESQELTAERTSEGLRAALMLAARQTAKQLGAPGGFNDDPGLRITIPRTELLDEDKPLPGAICRAHVTDCVKQMNAAAESAVAAAAAADIFNDAVSAVAFEDPRSVLNGADDAATVSFCHSFRRRLEEKFGPIVLDKLREFGVVCSFEAIAEAFRADGVVLEFDLAVLVSEKALEGFFTVMGGAEKAIRNTPAMRSGSQVLEEVFRSSPARTSTATTTKSMSGTKHLALLAKRRRQSKRLRR